MRLEDRIQVLVQLGQHLQSTDDYLEAVAKRTEYENPWFTVDNIRKAICAIRDEFLDEQELHRLADHYKLNVEIIPQVVGLVLAGNIPLVGFHDVLCVFVVGHRAKIKLSDKDKYLLPYLVRLLTQINSACAPYFEFVDKLNDFDAVIATGSNNSARYFELYFKDYPHVIRKNRNAVAVLTGAETKEDLIRLGQDIFTYFGLGCRNVSKIYIPRDFDFDPLLQALHLFNSIVLHSKYKNNYDYNYALLMMNMVPHKLTGSVILKEDQAFQSRIATLHYEYYNSPDQLEGQLQQHRDQIQCIVSEHMSFSQINSLPFGEAQQPGLMDYADGVDTVNFLLSI